MVYWHIFWHFSGVSNSSSEDIPTINNLFVCMEDAYDVEESKESVLDLVVSDDSGRRKKRGPAPSTLPSPISGKMKQVKFWGEIMTP